MTDCEFCNAQKSQYLMRFDHEDSEWFVEVEHCGRLRIYDSEFPGTIESRYIRFCPMCGRKFSDD